MFFIKTIFEYSFDSYGALRIREDLKKYGYFVSKRKVSKLMKLLGLQVRRSYKFKTLTDSNHTYPLASNLLNQNFNVERANQVWVSDMTYISTKQGWMYLTVIIDLFNRKVVGWSFSKDLTTENTIVRAWEMAINRNKITKDLIFHSDRGSQYASHNFTKLIKSYQGLVKQSMSRKGNCWDNAVAESFFKSLKVEWVYRYQYLTRSQAELSVFKWIETWYNRKRLHSVLGLKSIEEFEQ
jgi:transposase InsO family protein